MNESTGWAKLNFIAQCRAGGLGVWECPPFLFIVMGLINIASIFLTYNIANRTIEEPEIVALITIGVATVIFLIGSAIVLGFDKIVEANVMKSEFIGIISHQLRSPLAIFKWTLSSLTEDATRTPEAEPMRTSLQTLEETNERMIRLVNMLLEVNRIESNRLVLKKSFASLADMTEKQLKASRQYAEAQGIRLELHSPYQDTLSVDTDKIQMVIQNLVDNAIRYSRPGGIVSVTIKPLNHRFAVWEITDSGLGIPDDEKPYIFSKFYRARNAKIYQAEGNGIGLYIAKTVVREHGGELSFSSREGKGSTFWFTLPISTHRTRPPQTVRHP